MSLVYRPDHPEANENGMVPKEIAGERNDARSNLSFPMIVSDIMDPVQSMLDGKFYTSKSALRETYRKAGVIEVGNDPARLKKPPRKKPDRKQIKTTLEKAEARFNRGERVKRHKIAQA